MQRKLVFPLWADFHLPKLFTLLSFFLDNNHIFMRRMKIYQMSSQVRKEMVDEKGLEAEAADRIGEWVQMSGGEELVEKLLGTS